MHLLHHSILASPKTIALEFCVVHWVGVRCMDMQDLCQQRHSLEASYLDCLHQRESTVCNHCPRSAVTITPMMPSRLCQESIVPTEFTFDLQFTPYLIKRDRTRIGAMSAYPIALALANRDMASISLYCTSIVILSALLYISFCACRIQVHFTLEARLLVLMERL